MSTHIISATEASRTLSVILNRVHYQGEHYEIKRGKDIIAQIIPVAHKKMPMKVKALNEFFKNFLGLNLMINSCLKKILSIFDLKTNLRMSHGINTRYVRINSR